MATEKNTTGNKNDKVKGNESQGNKSQKNEPQDNDLVDGDFTGVIIKSRLTVKDIVGDIQKLFLDGKLKAEIGVTYPIARVLGRVNGFEYVDNNNFGVSCRFIGNCSGISLIDGHELVAKNCFLPKVAEDQLSALILALAEGVVTEEERQTNDDINIVRVVKVNEIIDFAYDILVEYTAKGRGYSFSATPLIKPNQSDPMAALKQMLPKLPKL